MLDWIEQHQGAVVLVLAFVFGLSGLLLFGVGLRLSRLVAEALRELRRLRSDEVRPYVVLDVALEGTNVVLALRNVGRRPACGVELRVGPECAVRVEDGRTIRLADLAIAGRLEFLPPQSAYEELASPSAAEFLRLNEARPTIEGRLEYGDPTGARYQVPVRIDLTPLGRRRRVVHRSLDDVHDSLEGLRAAVDALPGRLPPTEEPCRESNSSA